MLLRVAQVIPSDPVEMGRLFVNKEQDKASQFKKATDLLKPKKLDHLIGMERAPGQTVEVKSEAKTALIQDWKKAYLENPQQSLLMMAYSNRDVRDLNERARAQVKASLETTLSQVAKDLERANQKELPN